MSKELIERLRELSASRKPYATGAHGQIIGMESYRIVANGFALECIDEAAERIEELERYLLNLVCRIHRDGGHYIVKYGEAKAIADADTVAAQNNADLDALQAGAASRDAEVVSLTNQRDYEYVRAENAEQERDQLREHVTMLRDALLTCSVGDFSTGHVIHPSFDEKLVEEALSATEPKITKPT